MQDEKGSDDKLIAVSVDDPEFSRYYSVDELSPHRLIELRRFFIDYKILEGKQVNVEQMRGRREAEAAIFDAMALYRRLVRRGTPHARRSKKL
jgi:inorganic pyrophosphatase